MIDQGTLIAVLSTIGIVSLLFLTLGDYRLRRYRPLQIGPHNVRARTALADHLDQWPDDLAEGVVRWQDFASLTKHDVRELLYERGWYYRGQDMDADGWPLFATRDPQLAESAEPPPSRYTLLVDELQNAAAQGVQTVLIDQTPYQILTDEEIDEAAERTGWAWVEKLDGGTVPRMIMNRVEG